jgi:hypothetical protein
MGNSPTSIPLRVLCAGVAVLTGWVAVEIGTTGEFRSKTGVVELPLWARGVAAGVLGLMAVVAGAVALIGRR